MSDRKPLVAGAVIVPEEFVNLHDHVIADAAEGLGACMIELCIRHRIEPDALEPSQPWFEQRGAALFYCVRFGAHGAEYAIPSTCWSMKRGTGGGAN